MMTALHLMYQSLVVLIWMIVYKLLFLKFSVALLEASQAKKRRWQASSYMMHCSLDFGSM
jgi:hypothetical protein